ncbi:hypothetical protein PYW07_008816 [Mythimna separata]|uniref:Uncharacterized protein n=1 Tax=Mythimna separata TaxID=271217 RepID=A0AAD7YB05_MYTSE|nr:hypothetical protein PYW07_008816 [Mythimna separata]
MIRYCICAWGGACKTLLIAVERAQRAVLKVLMFLPYRHPTTSVYAKAEVLSVRRIYIMETVRRYHRHTIPTLPLDETKRVITCPIPRVRTHFAQKHYSARAPRFYNALNKVIKTRKFNHHQLKRALIAWLKDFDYEGTENLLNIAK